MDYQKQTVIIVAGGKGERMNAGIPKQFILLGGRPVLMHTIDLFYSYNNLIDIIVVLPENQTDNWGGLCEKHAFHLRHKIVTGGANRFESVKNGLSLAANDSLIAIHDGVRPLVSTDVIDNCFYAAGLHGAAVPVTDPVESIREISADGTSIAVDRSKYKLIQTPQVFRADILRKAYEQPFSTTFTDDASVVEASGVAIHLIEGNRENIKITTPFDLKLAELLLENHS